MNVTRTSSTNLHLSKKFGDMLNKKANNI